MICACIYYSFFLHCHYGKFMPGVLLEVDQPVLAVVFVLIKYAVFICTPMPYSIIFIRRIHYDNLGKESLQPCKGIFTWKYRALL